MAIGANKSILVPENNQVTTPVDTQNNQIVNPNLTQDPNKFRQMLLEDVGKASNQFQETQSRLGINPLNLEPVNFQEKGMKLAGKTIAAKELGDALNAQKLAVNNFLKASSFTDQVSSSIAAQKINDRLNNLRLDLIKRGLEFDKVLAKNKASREERAQAAKNFGAIAGTIAGGVIGGYMGKGAGAADGASLGEQVGGQMGGSFA